MPAAVEAKKRALKAILADSRKARMRDRLRDEDQPTAFMLRIGITPSAASPTDSEDEDDEGRKRGES